MLNQTSIEAANAATYVENYLDCVENFPDEVQRFITRIRELDVCYLNKVKAAQHWKDHAEKFPNQKKKSYIRMQQALSAAQEIGDEKMTTVQALNERIEGRYRSLDYDFKSLDLRRDEQTPADNRDIQVLSNSAAANNASVLLMERPNKRARRGGRGDFSVSENNQNEPTSIDQTPRNQNPSGSNTTQKKTGAGKKKKRKSRQNTQVQREDNSPKEEPIIDPDEPTYCLCDQISYGEMIMCDNDLCPIEWFHFSCVSLTTKPKGKWYCPKCRGDRPNVMKPKAQFLRELEKYNKEKEEKT